MTLHYLLCLSYPRGHVCNAGYENVTKITLIQTIGAFITSAYNIDSSMVYIIYYITLYGLIYSNTSVYARYK